MSNHPREDALAFALRHAAEHPRDFSTPEVLDVAAQFLAFLDGPLDDDPADPVTARELNYRVAALRDAFKPAPTTGWNPAWADKQADVVMLSGQNARALAADLRTADDVINKDLPFPGVLASWADLLDGGAA